jgi:signal transduction histidine kinase
MATNPIRRYHLSKLPERQPRSDTFPESHRSDPGRSRRQGGTGLGLSIVAAIVRRHHGQISLDSKVGSGSVFTVKLPVIS